MSRTHCDRLLERLSPERREQFLELMVDLDDISRDDPMFPPLLAMELYRSFFEALPDRLEGVSAQLHQQVDRIVEECVSRLQAAQDAAVADATYQISGQAKEQVARTVSEKIEELVEFHKRALVAHQQKVEGQSPSTRQVPLWVVAIVAALVGVGIGWAMARSSSSSPPVVFRVQSSE